MPNAYHTSQTPSHKNLLNKMQIMISKGLIPVLRATTIVGSSTQFNRTPGTLPENGLTQFNWESIRHPPPIPSTGRLGSIRSPTLVPTIGPCDSIGHPPYAPNMGQFDSIRSPSPTQPPVHLLRLGGYLTL